jgi:ribA/ribD-fused uncharacterized protein
LSQVIHFYSTNGQYGDFSNFAPYPIQLDGQTWPTTEHYFQAQKSMDPDLRKRIRKAPRPHDAARLGRSKEVDLRPDWERVKDGIMLEALRAKFTQHHHLRELLLATGDARLVEHTSRDSYWGDGGDGTGKNRLGRLLMQVRQELLADGAD